MLCLHLRAVGSHWKVSQVGAGRMNLAFWKDVPGSKVEDRFKGVHQRWLGSPWRISQLSRWEGSFVLYLTHLGRAGFMTNRHAQNCFHFFSNQFSGFYFLLLTQIKATLDPKQLIGKGDRNQSNEVKNIVSGRQDNKSQTWLTFKSQFFPRVITPTKNPLGISNKANSDAFSFSSLCFL